MTAIITRLAYALGLQERPDPGRRSASDSWPSRGCVTIDIDGTTPEELNDAIRPICLAFIAKVRLRQRARTT